MIVTLTTDFGTRDSYVAQLKGVLLSRAPAVTVVDVTHEVEPQDVLGGALLLEETVPWFPPGTVHLAVVDPGVGSARAPLLVETGRELLVGPDNGLLSLAAGYSPRLWTIDPARLPAAPAAPEGSRAAPAAVMSATFHGRDVFAPAAAWLAGGGEPAAIADPVADWVTLETPAPTEQPSGAGTERIVDGTVLAVDRFGSLVTNLPAPLARAHARSVVVEAAGQRIGPLRHTYSDVEPGQLLVLIGSSNRLEIAVRDGSAAARLGAAAGRGLPVRLRFGGEPP